MKIQLTNKGGTFETAPEGNGKAVCVDVTPLKAVQTQYGEKQKFKIVFELDPAAFGTREDGSPFVVWSQGFSPSTHENAALPKFLKTWMGKDFPSNLVEFDVETLLGRSAFIVIVHETGGKDGTSVFANIKVCTADNSGVPLKPSGKFVREEERAKTAPAGGGSTFRKAEQPEGAGRIDWQKTKVHVGKKAGLDLGDLDAEDVKKLIKNWVPEVKAKPKQTADDNRLLAALEAAAAFMKAEEDRLAAAAAASANEEPAY